MYFSRRERLNFERGSQGTSQCLGNYPKSWTEHSVTISIFETDKKYSTKKDQNKVSYHSEKNTKKAVSKLSPQGKQNVELGDNTII